MLDGQTISITATQHGFAFEAKAGGTYKLTV